MEVCVDVDVDVDVNVDVDVDVDVVGELGGEIGDIARAESFVMVLNMLCIDDSVICICAELCVDNV